MRLIRIKVKPPCHSRGGGNDSCFLAFRAFFSRIHILSDKRVLLGGLLIAIVLSIPCFLAAGLSQELAGVDSLSIGTPFSLTIHTDYPIGRVVSPDTLDGFAITQSHKIANNPRSWQMQIVPLKLGALSFPRLQVQHENPLLSPDSTDAFRIYVLSTLAVGDTLLRDIKPLERYPLQLPLWLYLLLALTALLIAVYLIVRYNKMHHKPQAKPVPEPKPQPPVKQLPAWQIALSQLESLKREQLWERGEVVLYHFRLSEILRRFLESTYSFTALEMTVNEISRFLSSGRIPATTEILEFLTFCDLVKFAKKQASADEIQTHSDWLLYYLLKFQEAARETVNVKV